ncbi:MAG: sulfatase/phosphatase domain-containing protein, partial [Chthoniobacterales bacterium]
RNQRFKLITYRIGDDHRSELYDLENDPWETNNLAEKKEYAATKKELITALQDWQVRNGDTQSL